MPYPLQFTLNGKPVDLLVEPNWTLMQLLRDRLDSFDLSPDGKRLTFAVSRHLAAAA